MSEQQVLTVNEVADRLRMHPATVRLWLRTKRMTGTYMGSDKAGWRITAAEVERVLREGPGSAHS